MAGLTYPASDRTLLRNALIYAEKAPHQRPLMMNKPSVDALVEPHLSIFYFGADSRKLSLHFRADSRKLSLHFRADSRKLSLHFRA